MTQTQPPMTGKSFLVAAYSHLPRKSRGYDIKSRYGSFIVLSPAPRSVYILKCFKRFPHLYIFGSVIVKQESLYESSLLF
jgi:hypothetical protein